MRAVKSKVGQSLIDMAVEMCGSVGSCVDMAVLNNLAIGSKLTEGTIMTATEVTDFSVVKMFANISHKPATEYDGETDYEDDVSVASLYDGLKESAKDSTMLKTLPGQSLLDVAVERCGSIEGALDLAVANDLVLGDELSANYELMKTSVIDEKIATVFTNISHKPATSVSGDDIEKESQGGEGISFWAVNIDFVVGGGPSSFSVFDNTFDYTFIEY